MFILNKHVYITWKEVSFINPFNVVMLPVSWVSDVNAKILIILDIVIIFS